MKAVGLEEYDRSFAQTLIEELHVESLKDLFAVSGEKLKEAGLSGERYEKFSEKLHSRVSNAPAYVLLGKLGVPSLWKEQAKAILALLDPAERDPLGAFIEMLDRELWSDQIAAAVGVEKSSVIQYWLRCNCQAGKIFREELETLYQEVHPDN